MQSRSVHSFFFLLTACLAATTTAAQLTVFRGTFVHSRERTEMEVLEDYLIGFDENNQGNIVFVRPATELESVAQQWSFNQNDVVTLTNSQFLMPGFVECHLNPSQYLRTGQDFASVLDFSSSTFILAELQFRNVTYAREASMKAVRHTLMFGITTATYYGSSSVNSNIELARVVDQLGQRAFIHQFSLDVVPDSFQEVAPPNFAQSTEEALNASRRFIELIRELENPLIRASIGPELSSTTSPDVVRGLGEIANETDVFVQIRFAQLASENITTLPEWEAVGILPVNRTMMIYGTNIRESEMETLRRRGISIAHCPYGDFNFIAGILDVKRMLNFGITVGLGTDIAVGYSPSVLTEMRVALLASRALRLNLTMNLPADYTQLTLAEGFYMATMGGAEALRLGDTVGNFEVGKQFDALLIDTSAPSPSNPVFDTTSSDTTMVRIEKFLYLGDDRNIQKVFVAGREIMLRSTESPTTCNSAPPTSLLSLMMGVVLLAAAKLLI